MSLLQLKKDGWFDPPKEIDLPELSREQLLQIRSGETVIIPKNGESILIYLKQGYDLNKLTVDDIIVRQIPYVISSAN